MIFRFRISILNWFPLWLATISQSCRILCPQFVWFLPSVNHLVALFEPADPRHLAPRGGSIHVDNQIVFSHQHLQTAHHVPGGAGRCTSLQEKAYVCITVNEGIASKPVLTKRKNMEMKKKYWRAKRSTEGEKVHFKFQTSNFTNRDWEMWRAISSGGLTGRGFPWCSGSLESCCQAGNKQRTQWWHLGPRHNNLVKDTVTVHTEYCLRPSNSWMGHHTT